MIFRIYFSQYVRSWYSDQPSCSYEGGRAMLLCRWEANSGRSSLKWALMKCLPIILWRAASGTLTPCFSPSSTRLAMRMTHSSWHVWQIPLTLYKYTLLADGKSCSSQSSSWLHCSGCQTLSASHPSCNWNYDLLWPLATDPATTPLGNMPSDYVARVKATHETGDYGGGSTGWVPRINKSAALHFP